MSRALGLATLLILVACGSERPANSPYSVQTSHDAALEESDNALEDQTDAALADAVRRIGGSSVDGKYDSKVCRQSRGYARVLASQEFLDHHAGFKERAKQIGGNASEIIAQTWGPKEPISAHAAKCAKLWENSPGHNKHMMAYHDRYCYSMTRGASGRFYCVGLFAD